jgi:LuxR family maltose regulon positive regulatory protein
VLQALAHHAAGALPEALASLGRALGGAPEPDNYVRLFLDEGAPMLALLQQADSDSAGEEVQGQVCRLLDRAQAPRSVAEPQQPLMDPLSQRELEVLRMLDSELTGPQIAQELYVTLNTLRTHTKRIFTKLDAKTRAAAVRQARDYGLI